MKIDCETMISGLEQRKVPQKKIVSFVKTVEASFGFFRFLSLHEDPSLIRQFQFFIDWFMPQLLVHYNTKTDSKLPEWARGIAADLWFFCFKIFDGKMQNRIFIDGDYDLFWSEFGHWAEKVESRCKPMDIEKALYQRYAVASEKSEWMNIDECTKFTGLAAGTIYNYVSKGKIPHSKKGGLRFNRKKIDAWLAEDELDPGSIEREVKAEFGKKLA